MTYLVDTSVLTRLRNPTVKERLSTEMLRGAIRRTSITDLGSGFSARSGAEWHTLMGALRQLPLEPITEADFERALSVQSGLAAVGHKGRKVPDLIIAAVAQRVRLTVLHYDRDFDLIAAHTGQPCEWVTASGTID